jgi:pimeloyl-ACP methyl ester carboxylesterase
MTDTSLPFAEKKFTEVKGHRMAYIDEGEGAPIVFQHGNPTRWWANTPVGSHRVRCPSYTSTPSPALSTTAGRATSGARGRTRRKSR